jgi:hypothetical protein
MPTILLINSKKEEGFYRVQRGRYVTLLNFLKSNEHSIYRLNDDIDSNYYWVKGLSGRGTWYRGGYFHKPFINDFCDVFVELKTMTVYKRINLKNPKKFMTPKPVLTEKQIDSVINYFNTNTKNSVLTIAIALGLQKHLVSRAIDNHLHNLKTT